MAIDDGRGLEIYREVIGDLGPIERLRSVLPDIDRYVVDFFYGEIYARPALDLRTREVVSVTSLATLGTAGPQLRAHINGALNVGSLVPRSWKSSCNSPSTPASRRRSMGSPRHRRCSQTVAGYGP